MKYAKAIVGVLIVGLGTTKVALGDNSISSQEVIEIVSSMAVAGVGVWRVPNKTTV